MFPELLHDDVDDSVEDLADRCLHAVRMAWTASRLSCVQEGILLATAMFQNADVTRCMDVTYLSEGIIRLCAMESDQLPYKVKVKLKNLIVCSTRCPLICSKRVPWRCFTASMPTRRELRLTKPLKMYLNNSPDDDQNLLVTRPPNASHKNQFAAEINAISEAASGCVHPVAQ